MFHKILVAIDGSPASEKALAAAVDLTHHYQADLVALSVAEAPEVVGLVDDTAAESGGEEQNVSAHAGRRSRNLRPLLDRSMVQFAAVGARLPLRHPFHQYQRFLHLSHSCRPDPGAPAAGASGLVPADRN